MRSIETEPIANSCLYGRVKNRILTFLFLWFLRQYQVNADQIYVANHLRRVCGQARGIIRNWMKLSLIDEWTPLKVTTCLLGWFVKNIFAVPMLWRVMWVSLRRPRRLSFSSVMGSLSLVSPPERRRIHTRSKVRRALLPSCSVHYTWSTPLVIFRNKKVPKCDTG